MNQLQRSELETLGRRLPDVPPEKFDMLNWAKGELDTDSPEFNCNFAGCAIGWLPKLVPTCRLTFICDEYEEFIPAYNSPDTGTEYRHYGAIACYFGINITDALFLFAPNRYASENPSPAVVGARILDFLGREATQGREP